MDWTNSAWPWWSMLLMTLLVVLFVGGLIWALFALTRSSLRVTTAEEANAEETLDERFARGEIDASEYRERMHALHATKRKP